MRFFKTISKALVAGAVVACCVVADDTTLSMAGTTELNHQYQASLYQANESAIDAPMVAWRTNAKDANALLAGVCTKGQRPNVVEVTVKAASTASNSISVCDASGSLEYDLSLPSFCKSVESYAIPALRIAPGDTTTAKAVSSFCKEYGLKDAYVISSRSTASYVAKHTSNVRAVADYGSEGTLSTDALLNIIHDVTSSGIDTVIFDSAVMDQEKVRYANVRCTNVWLAVSDTGDVLALHKAIAAGADVVMGNDYKALCNAFKSYSGTNSLFSYPSIIAHRGAKCVEGIKENTIKAFEWGLKNGCDGIECDVRNVKGAIYVTHATPTAKARKTTLTLDALFSKYEDTDKPIYVELKIDKHLGAKKEKKLARGYMRSLRKLIAAHPKIKDQVVIISFYECLLKALAKDKELNWIPRCYLETFWSFSHKSVEESTKLLESLNALYDPRCEQVDYAKADAFMSMATKRGLTSGYWMPNYIEEDRAIAKGSKQLTTDTSDRSKNYVTNIKLKRSIRTTSELGVNRNPLTGVVNVPEASSLGFCVKQVGKSARKALSYVSLDGNLTQENGVYKINGSKALVCLSYTQQMKDRNCFTLYSEPFYLVAKDVSESELRTVTVEWQDDRGSVVKTEEYVLPAGPDAQETVPNYGSDAIRLSSSKHLEVTGWKDMATGKVFTGTLPALGAQDAGTTVVYRAQGKRVKHTRWNVPACQQAPQCKECGYVMGLKKSHNYKAGICKRCFKVTSASKPTITKLKVKSGPKLSRSGAVKKRGRVKVKWKAAKGADYYEIICHVGNSHLFAHSLVKGKKTSAVIRKKAFAGTIGYRMRAVIVVDGQLVYGKWSNGKSVTIR